MTKRSKRKREVAPIESTPTTQLSGTYKVKNTNNFKVELSTDEGVVVLLPNQVKEVPANFVIPQGIGVYKR